MSAVKHFIVSFIGVGIGVFGMHFLIGSLFGQPNKQQYYQEQQYQEPQNQQPQNPYDQIVSNLNKK